MINIVVFFCTLIIACLCAFASNVPRWQNMPVKVYIPSGNKYSELMTKAFNEWQTVSGGIVKFKYVDKQENSDIYVKFTGNLGMQRDGTHALGLTHYHTRNGYFTQNYIEIDTTKYFGDKSNKRGESIRIYQVMLHEIGHAVGLPHSDDINSLMYYMYDKKEHQTITDSDLKELKKKYR